MGDHCRFHHLRHHHGGFRRPLARCRLYRRSDLAVALPGCNAVLWRWSQDTIAVNTVTTPKVEAFYWAAITFSQTLGTALGDWIADTGGLGYEGGALIFGAALIGVVALYFFTSTSRVLLFWTAFILTRPLGATVGDFLDKPVSDGGLALSRPLASAVIAAFIVICVLVLPQRAGRHPGAGKTDAEFAGG